MVTHTDIPYFAGSSRVQDVKSEMGAGAMPPLMNEMLIEDQE